MAETKHTPGPEEIFIEEFKKLLVNSHRSSLRLKRVQTKGLQACHIIDTLQHQRNMLRDACKAVWKDTKCHPQSSYVRCSTLDMIEAAIAATRRMIMAEEKKEFFIVANSFAAPFFSDTSTGYQEADTAKEALELFAEKYNHPCGLYAAIAYSSADAYHKGEHFLARWLSNHAKFMEGKTGMIRGIAPGRIEINGIIENVNKPKEGCVVEAQKGPEGFVEA